MLIYVQYHKNPSAVGPYPEPDESSPELSTTFLYDPL
jgi:hypothetical protein